ncbi:heavy-metal-associated domain-containing protein [Nocardiopsis sp. CNT312]|uniref:heavy-metal-associated domain-containing protein n=1 Tax=Nocardiopsis sp. CNT312 TaxID=1137268 RepID=UPI000491AC2D|nr:heavy metal-associated domain-containing protein [Nocardiopsis sp. CNT312]
MAATTTAVYNVEGMSCGHCVGAVTEEVTAVPGVTGVEVDLETGRVTVTGDGPVDADSVRSAIDEAGYGVRG